MLKGRWPVLGAPRFSPYRALELLVLLLYVGSVYADTPTSPHAGTLPICP
jgi:hypothetical protein